MKHPALIVLAKAPVPGRAKTRCSPPCSPVHAARLAEAALADTLCVAAKVGGVRLVLALEGKVGPWLPSCFDVLAQRGTGLAARLAAAFDDVGGPALLIGMDTPQVTPGLLAEGLEALTSGRSAAVLGRASDGGYWAIGLRAADPLVFEGIPMSTACTGVCQRRRLADLGLSTHDLPELCDVDTFATAREVARLLPGSRFADTVDAIECDLSRRGASVPAGRSGGAAASPGP